MTIFGLAIDDIKTIAEIAGITGAALATIWRWIWIPSSNLLKKIDTIEKQLPVIIKIAEEFKPNGGNSLKDAINRLEVGLANNRDRHRLIICELGLATFETDKEGHYTWVSESWQDITGVDFYEAMGNGWVNAIHPVDRHKATEEWAEAVEQDRIFKAAYFINSDRIVKVNVYASPVKDLKRNTISYVGSISLVENQSKNSMPSI
jgi:PAS domain S-box-containing protein